MNAVYKNATLRLFGRALFAALSVAVVQIHNSNHTQIAWQSVAVGAGLAFAEVFTPLNAIVGFFTKKQ